ncbi:MAG TPA: transcription antitermination factor NusB [Oligoflexia bacterium]|nr:transcription antitermination factor NusB [Oligoflexia bacterium]HMR24331.1 transcription antitermination factor NusB [Oligoflexia bacterium]
MIRRRRSREQALQILYFMDYADVEAHEARNLFQGHFEVKNADASYMQTLIFGVEDHQVAIDEILEKALEHWKLYRLGKIDKSILRIGVYEMVFAVEKIASPVAINEAVELGKKYGDEKTSSFVNGVLDRVAKEYQR